MNKNKYKIESLLENLIQCQNSPNDLEFHYSQGLPSPNKPKEVLLTKRDTWENVLCTGCLYNSFPSKFFIRILDMERHCSACSKLLLHCNSISDTLHGGNKQNSRTKTALHVPSAQLDIKKLTYVEHEVSY